MENDDEKAERLIKIGAVVGGQTPRRKAGHYVNGGCEEQRTADNATKREEREATTERVCWALGEKCVAGRLLSAAYILVAKKHAGLRSTRRGRGGGNAKRTCAYIVVDTLT